MAAIKMKNRLFGNYKYATCELCGHNMQIDKPIKTDLPYCSNCRTFLLDAGQKYCFCCGEKFE